MRWIKLIDTWECSFENVPFKVVVTSSKEGVRANLCIVGIEFWEPVTTKHYPSIDVAQAEVESFVLNHLALYSVQVHRECLNANVMTWRKLKEQLEQIPEDQLDEAIRVLDSEDDWLGEPEIIKAEKDRIKYKDGFKDCTDYVGSWEDREIALEKGKYYLSIKL